MVERLAGRRTGISLGRFRRLAFDWYLPAYIHLWLFEGVVRKWVFPEGSQLLYIFRDGVLLPVGIVLLLIRLRNRPRQITLPRTGPGALGMVLIITWLASLMTWAITSSLVNGPSLSTAVLGIRSYLVPASLPVIVYCIRTTQTRTLADKAILWWVVPTSLIALAQAVSPQQSFVNRVGADAYQDLLTSGDTVRATGTFTAPAGLAVYVPLALAVLLSRSRTWNAKAIPDVALFSLLLTALLIVVAIGGSRFLLIGIVVVLVAYLFLCWDTDLWPWKGYLVAGILVTLVIASSYLSEVISNFEERISEANSNEDSGARILDSTNYFMQTASTTLLGDGPGTHSTAAVQASGGLGWVENDLPRTTQELGAFGVVINLTRQSLILAFLALGLLRRDVLVVLLSAALLPSLLSGQVFAQPSVQGFGAIGLSFLVLAVSDHPAARRQSLLPLGCEV